MNDCKYRFLDGKCSYWKDSNGTVYTPCQFNETNIALCKWYKSCYDVEGLNKIINEKDHNAVEHPNHYCQGGIECIKAIEASMTPAQFQGYCKGNAIKYMWRYEHKNGIEDLKKARVYLDWMIESLEKENETSQ